MLRYLSRIRRIFPDIPFDLVIVAEIKAVGPLGIRIPFRGEHTSATNAFEAQPKTTDAGEEIDKAKAGARRLVNLSRGAFAQGSQGQLRNPTAFLISIGTAKGYLKEVSGFLYRHTSLLSKAGKFSQFPVSHVPLPNQITVSNFAKMA
ncbi:hypothetical protein PPNSA23_28660 [Phyllobacterium phragmitis]|uniref:Uncharacterized protein n=1 Tax=Phyllobacterium phragmitis TaxID=2670329 RepID=A0ABQ0H1W2_9HYPH